MRTAPTVTTKRPASFIVMVALRALNGFFGMFTGALLLTAPDSVIIGAVILTLSILSLLLLVGLWLLRPWARRFTLGLISLTMPLGMVGVFMSGGSDPGTYLGVIGDAFTLYLLLQTRIKQLFT